MDKNTLAQLHNVQVEILNEFVRVCKEYNLTYFLAFGTLLGAVRHKGFIPWDDDIDIAMPRKDYDVFLDLYANKDDTNYYLLSERCPANISFHYNPFAKLCKKGTVIAEGGRLPENYSGIYIDIYPYDNCVLFFLPFQVFIYSLSLKLYRLKTKKDIPQNKIKALFSNIICKFIPLRFSKYLMKLSYSLFNNLKTKYISFLSDIYCETIKPIKYSSIYPLSEMMFEGHLYYVPANYDNVLSVQYGNYMETPPVEQQITHSPEYIIFDTNTHKIS